MNQGTYEKLCERDEMVRVKAEEMRLKGSIRIDNDVPADMVRLAGNRYVTRRQFARMLRREIR